MQPTCSGSRMAANSWHTSPWEVGSVSTLLESGLPRDFSEQWDRAELVLYQVWVQSLRDWLSPPFPFRVLSKALCKSSIAFLRRAGGDAKTTWRGKKGQSHSCQDIKHVEKIIWTLSPHQPPTAEHQVTCVNAGWSRRATSQALPEFLTHRITR